MKLTKAQRLFMKAGIADYILRAHRDAFKNFRLSPEYEDFNPAYLHREIKQLSARRKKLIREALEAWKTEEIAAYNEGYGDGIYDN